MSNDIHALALRNTLDEIRSICPEIKSVFAFKDNGEVVSGDDRTPEKTIARAIDSFKGIIKTESIGEIECIALKAGKGNLNIFRSSQTYVVTITEENANVKHVNTMVQVLIPTVQKLAEKLNPAPLNENPGPKVETKTDSKVEIETEPEIDIEPEVETIKEPEPTHERKKKTEAPKPTSRVFDEPVSTGNELEPEIETETESEPEDTLPEPPMNQLIVENLGGLLVPSDTVRVDNQTLSQWSELCADKKLEEVEIETFDGKIMRCKVKPIKDSKYEGKGIVQMPEKVQLTLEIRKGELVRVKPLIE